MPGGWYETSTEAGRFTDPIVRLAVSSGPIQSGSSTCQASSYDFPEDEVAIVVVEWTTPLLLRGTRGTPRPQQFTAESLPIHEPPAIECFAGSGGSAQFVEAGRMFGAYVLLAQEAPAELAAKARAVLDTLLIDMQVSRPVKLVALAKKRVAHCQRSSRLRTICPTRVPLVRAPYLSHLSRDPLRPTGSLDVFDLERGGEDPEHPERNRPPRMAHIGILAGDTEMIGPWLEPWDEPAFALRYGLLKAKRDEPVSFGLVTWGKTRGLLFLAPPFPTGGYLGNHLVFVWKTGAASKAVSLHAWEPLTEAAATLRAITMSAEYPAFGARLDARSDAVGVLYVDGSGWTCAPSALVDLPNPWAETMVQTSMNGEFHLKYPVPSVKPYQGTVTVLQRCEDGSTIRSRAKIIVGDERAGETEP